MFNNYHVMMVAVMSTVMNHYHLLFGVERQHRQARAGKKYYKSN
jgi:heme exporter protein D